MDRRTLLGTATALAAPAQAAGQGGAPARRATARLRLGHQHRHSPEWLDLLASLGVEAICSGMPSRTFDESWSVAGLSRLREQVERRKMQLAMIPLPMSSAAVERAESPHIMLGKSPERDREIDNVCRIIENAARVGIPAVKYNLTLLGVLRTARTPGRGAASYSTFRFAEARADGLTAAGRVEAEQLWERIDYFLKRVLPVAEANKIRMACHPHDPAIPGGRSFRGVPRVLGSPEGLKRFIGLSASPYHGLNFCQGTVSEMLQDPRNEILPLIRHFGERGRIFNVHFRNIRGRIGDFQETFPDAGDVDMLQALRAYRDCGYDGMIMPDHAPRIPGDDDSRQAFAFAFGYIRGLIQAVNSDSL